MERESQLFVDADFSGNGLRRQAEQLIRGVRQEHLLAAAVSDDDVRSSDVGTARQVEDDERDHARGPGSDGRTDELGAHCAPAEQPEHARHDGEAADAQNALG